MFDKNEIIEMARQAGLGTPTEWHGRTYIEHGNAMLGVELEAFAKLVAAKEREEIALFIENTRMDKLPLEVAQHYALLLSSYAKAIRARGEA